MSAPSLRHFQGRPVFGDLTPLGIKTRKFPEPATVETIDGRPWKHLGSIYAYSTGEVVVVHYEDTTPFEVALLVGQAEDVWRGVIVPTKARFWTFVRRDDRPDFWSTKIFGPADVLRDEAVAVAEAEHITRAAVQPTHPPREGTPMPDTADVTAPTIPFTAGEAIATSRGVTFPAVTVDRSDPGRVMITLYDPTSGDSDQAAIVEFDLDHEQALQLASALRVGPATGHRLDALTGLGVPVQLALSSNVTRATLTATVDGRTMTLRGFYDEAQTLARALAAVTKHHAEPATSAEVWLAR